MRPEPRPEPRSEPRSEPRPEPRSGPRALPSSLLLALAFTVVGYQGVACRGGADQGGFELAAATAGREVPGLSLPGPAAGMAAAPKLVDVEVGQERRPAVLLPAGEWSWRGVLPREGVFALGVAVPPGEGEGVEELAVTAELVLAGRGGRVREVLDLARGDGSGWLDLTADLGAYAGEEVTLRILPHPRGPVPPEHLAWSWAGITPALRGRREHPNILFILIDTLRADHLTPYGYSRDTSPHIRRLLAEPGVVVETAISQAPWTVPSAVSYMTGRQPGDLLTGPIEGYHIPEGVTTLAEELASRGYATGAFYGNFILRDANGFGRGFATRYTPEPVPESNFLHADSVNARALPWLRAHGHRPFFAYVHYMDPHDPYLAPDLASYRSPYFPDYTGKLSGLFVHGLYTGKIPLEDPRADVAQITALYDSEIHYVDRAVAQLIENLPPEVVAETLIVLASDHGEELYDHGGWKHGQSLYQEQIHVPLLLRWDGHLPPGRRLAGTVQLVDLMPTLLAAAGGEVSAERAAEWDGIDLLPALRGDEALPRRPAFAQHLASGPLRAAVLFEGQKLIFWNAAEPFVSTNDLIDHLWRLDLGRFERRELYDLRADPGENENRIGSDVRTAGALEPALHHRLDHTLPGLRLIASDLPPGARLSGRIAFAGPVLAWHPYFLSPDDRISSMGNELRFELIGEGEGAGPREKGLWLEGLAGPILELEARLDGEPLAATAVLLGGDGAPYRGGAVELAALAAEGRPAVPAGPALRLWTRPRTAVRAGAIDPEVERSLRALGYVQ